MDDNYKTKIDLDKTMDSVSQTEKSNNPSDNSLINTSDDPQIKGTTSDSELATHTKPTSSEKASRYSAVQHESSITSTSKTSSKSKENPSSSSADDDQLWKEISVLGYSEIQKRIRTTKDALGNRVQIIAHHYQKDEIVKHADRLGDSYDLALHIGESTAEYNIFCGVHFMAEMGVMLSKPEQKVILPDMQAGCPLADTASIEQLEECWNDLSYYPDLGKIIPITYINSSAAIKSFVGQHDGIVCTSSNAENILEWALNQGDRVIFLPDQHLGRNTSYFRMNISLAEMTVWEPGLPYGGNTHHDLRRSRIILWDGSCCVHQGFRPLSLMQWRQEHPGSKIIVHPECEFGVVSQADYFGSTKQIIELVKSSPTGTSWGIGTERNLVNRLKSECRYKEIFQIPGDISSCKTMNLINDKKLLYALEKIRLNDPINIIEVDQEISKHAKVALERMIEQSL